MAPIDVWPAHAWLASEQKAHNQMLTDIAWSEHLRRHRRALAHYRHRYLLRRDMWRAAGGDPARYEQIARWYLAGW